MALLRDQGKGYNESQEPLFRKAWFIHGGQQ